MREGAGTDQPPSNRTPTQYICVGMEPSSLKARHVEHDGQWPYIRTFDNAAVQAQSGQWQR